MKKQFSFTLLLSVGICTAATFATCKFNSRIGEIDRFGFPFTFFSADNTGEVIQNSYFSAPALIINYLIALVISIAIVSLINLLKVEKKNTTLAH
ncbi:MAG: hypothetical protein NTZ59_02795 [Bacteroidetes bacterium]|jgi:hypothetical protein|nr:hypothetical protein [Bacteroidota bacterium]